MGYKMFILCDNHGIVHNFTVYTGTILPVPGLPDVSASGNVVLQIAQVIPTHSGYKIYFETGLLKSIL